MDFEWEKLINGESEIDADDINALADGIIGNKKAIKAIKDIMDNGGTIPEYLTNFFKTIPDGLSIDDLCGYKYIGCYLVEETQNVYGLDCDVKYLLFVNTGVFANNEEQRDEGHIFQTRYYFDAYNGIVKIQTRMDMYNEAAGLWEDWQDVFATPQYVNEQIAQIPTGGGGETWELLQSKEISETDGELSQIVITLPAEYKEFVITVERTVPTSSSNTIIYPRAISYNNRSIEFPTSFWDSYEGGKASYFELRLSSMMLAKNNALKMDGFFYESNQTPKGKLKTIKTSGWIDGAIRWDVLRIVSKLNVGSIYKVWGCK